ncbi:hypothetical protein, partial [Methanoculleus sp.]|uniref:hypothetical protein n=1 Tax=Methanoculleus sp. TaxID=90427 RepID=UPI0025D3AF54
IIEQILEVTVLSGFKDNPFFERFVDFKNVKLGDINSFYLPDNSLFTVSDTAEGIYGVRRQRINKGQNVSIPTQLKTIQVYEEANRLLSGRMDIIEFLDKIEKSFMNRRGQDIYNSFIGGLGVLNAAFIANGAFVENTLLNICENVEAATGNPVTIVGTRTALRSVNTAVLSEKMRESHNELGYYGSFNGINMMRIPQIHAQGTYNQLITNRDLFIVTSSTKPVKFCTEGEAIVESSKSMFENADMTYDIFAGERYGVGLLMDTVWGQYRLP